LEINFHNFNISSNMDNCLDCKRPEIDYNWCQNCNSKRFQQNFDKWTSGNKYIDKFIQEAQLKAKNCWDVIEWIPYNRLRNIEYITKGGFSTIYKAIWLDGYMEYWDNRVQTWYRYSFYHDENDYKIAKEDDVKSPLNENENRGYYVVLKSLNNSSNINDDFLNEVSYFLRICFNINDYSYFIHIYLIFSGKIIYDVRIQLVKFFQLYAHME